jgi:uncharacterized BrkB/YihY/UPF0761 family membrane protein
MPQEQTMRQSPRANPILEFILGIVLTIALQVIAIVLGILLIYGSIAVINVLQLRPNDALPVIITGAPALFIGVTQIAYLAPIYAYFAKRGRYEVGKGILLGAIVTLLLNGSCFAQSVYVVNNYLGIQTYHAFAQIVAIALLISGTIGWLGVQWVQRSRPPQ